MGSLTVTLPPPRVASSLQAVKDPDEHPSGDHAVATGSLAATPIDQSGPEPSDSVGPVEHPSTTGHDPEGQVKPQARQPNIQPPTPVIFLSTNGKFSF